MKKLLVLLIFATLCIMLVSCDLSMLTGHTCEYGAWQITEDATCSSFGKAIRYCTVCSRPDRANVEMVPHTPKNVSATAATCVSAGYSDGVICSVCNVIISGCAKTPPSGHTPTDMPGKAATCSSLGVGEGKICLVCNEVLSPGEVIDMLPHTEEIIPATDKRTEGKKCSVCETIIVKPTYIIATDFETPEKYDGDWGLAYLSSLDRGELYTELYLRMDEACDDFHSFESGADKEYVIAKLDYSDLNITSDEALMVWCCYRNDRPLYYWMSGEIKYTSKQLWLLVDEEYAIESVRLDFNNMVYDKVGEYIDIVSSADSHYDVALALHDAIILASDYAYGADGKTPDNSMASHNILGTLLLGRGVCESYARTYQLLLNYLDIENIFVTGYSNGVPHAWNMVKMDDGEYYWFDLTWDDQPTHMWGVTHNYFCVSATENVGWQDGVYDSDVFDTEYFLDDHVVDGQEMGVNFLYTLPTPAEYPYDFSDAIIRETSFTVGGFTYVVCGYLEVQLVKIEGEGDIIIPESVSFGGEEYKVISVGKIVDGIFRVNSVADPYANITSIFVPETVKYIFHGAFNIAYLRSIVVDSDNEKYFDINGVLYSFDNFFEAEWIPNSRG